MAQTTDQISGVANYLATSANNSSWTDRSGYSNSVAVGGQSRMTGETYTFEGDTALLAFGKREPIEITVRVVYTEDASSHWEAARAAFEAGTQWQLRWAPDGNAAGNFQYSTGTDSRISEFNFPEPDSSEAGPLLVEYTVRTAAITKAVISS